jgi:hypothetical protein
VRILLKRQEDFPDGSYVLEGKVVKNRWGYRDRIFYIFMLAGKGIHKGLTAMYDGIILGKVERKKSIKIGETNMGFLKNIIEKAQEGNEEYFQPFYDVLKGDEDVTGYKDIGGETMGDSNSEDMESED